MTIALQMLRSTERIRLVYKRQPVRRRAVVSGLVSSNRGFRYADAMRIVRPDLAAKLIADTVQASSQSPEKPPCDLLPFGPMHDEGSP